MTGRTGQAATAADAQTPSASDKVQGRAASTSPAAADTGTAGVRPGPASSSTAGRRGQRTSSARHAAKRATRSRSTRRSTRRASSARRAPAPRDLRVRTGTEGAASSASGTSGAATSGSGTRVLRSASGTSVRRRPARARPVPARVQVAVTLDAARREGRHLGSQRPSPGRSTARPPWDRRGERRASVVRHGVRRDGHRARERDAAPSRGRGTRGERNVVTTRATRAPRGPRGTRRSFAVHAPAARRGDRHGAGDASGRATPRTPSRSCRTSATRAPSATPPRNATRAEPGPIIRQGADDAQSAAAGHRLLQRHRAPLRPAQGVAPDPARPRTTRTSAMSRVVRSPRRARPDARRPARAARPSRPRTCRPRRRRPRRRARPGRRPRRRRRAARAERLERRVVDRGAGRALGVSSSSTRRRCRRARRTSSSRTRAPCSRGTRTCGWKATPTIAAAASTTWRSASAAPKPCSQAMVLSGVRDEALEAISYGEERPRCTDQGEECRATNRRVDILVAP